jgi:aspartate/methionine/tyrosine aminotransferase
MEMSYPTSFSVLARARELEKQGKSIIHFQIGEPDFDTPDHIKDAAVQALRDGFTHYTASQGILELREAITEHEGHFKGIHVGPERVVVTPGAKAMILYALSATLKDGEEVIYPDPGYLSYRTLIQLAGGTPVPLPLSFEDEFRLDVNRLESMISNRTKAIILNSPSNPTGAVLEREILTEVARIALNRGLYVISDEIYSRIIYEGLHFSVFMEEGMDERTFMVDGFSKTYAMTGWRLGYGIVPEKLVKNVVRFLNNSVSCATSFVQKAGVAALRGPQEPVREMVREFTARRELILKKLNEIEGIQTVVPHGAFYVFPNVEELPISCLDFSELLLEKYGVALLPGGTFGENGVRHLRFSYANSRENIEEGLSRFKDAVDSLRT